MTSLNYLTISQAKDGLQKGKFKAIDLVHACLNQIHKSESRINALISVCEKEALDKAKRMDRTADYGLPLAGIPVVLKDIYCTKNIKTTAGSKLLADFVPVYDATVVKRLEKAGAIILGKSNLDAWAHGSSGENSDFGPTKNPWNTDYVPGGSSSGSAAALSSGECLFSTGTDTGGSIRLPAAFCNLVGLKPTYGRVSRYGVIAMSSSMDSIGHFSRTVEDSARILQVAAGFDSLDATTPNLAVPDYLKNIQAGIKNLKIGIPDEYFGPGLDTRIKRLMDNAFKELIELGAKIIPVSLPHTQEAVAVYYLIQPAEVSSNLARFDGIRYGASRSDFGKEAKRRIILGTYTLSAGYYDAYYLKAMKVRTLIKQDFDSVFNQVQAIIAPVSPTTAWKLGEKTKDPLKMYLSDLLTIPANLAGLPAISIPIGFVDKMPMGMQIIGPQFKEDILFKTGYAYQQATKWHENKPLFNNTK